MAQIKISSLTTGTPKGTDLTPATDTTDTTQAASGTTKKYIRSDEFNYVMNALSYATKSACRVASTVALTATYVNGALGVGATLTNAGAMAALTLDGVSVAVNDRVLIWNQATQAQNGIYTVTTVGSGAVNWVLTRATDYDQAAEIAQGQVVLVNQGTTYTGKAFQQVGFGPWTMGTTAIVFELFNPSQAAFNWNTVTAASITMAVNNGYFANNAGLVTLTLPATSVPGDTVKVNGQGAGGWLIAQGAGQQIHIGSSASTLGAGGSVASTNQYDCLTLVCQVANTIWSLDGAPQSSGLTIV
jgi:hypothetical protein